MFINYIILLTADPQELINRQDKQKKLTIAYFFATTLSCARAKASLAKRDSRDKSVQSSAKYDSIVQVRMADGGLRPCVQVAVYSCRRGFESHSWQFLTVLPSWTLDWQIKPARITFSRLKNIAIVIYFKPVKGKRIIFQNILSTLKPENFSAWCFWSQKSTSNLKNSNHCTKQNKRLMEISGKSDFMFLFY